MTNIKIALRHLFKNKVYALISIFGLAIGISCCLLIALNVFHEMSFDQFHEKKERIYKINASLDFNGELNSALTSLAVGPTVQDEYPEVESYVRFRNMNGITVSYEDKIFTESNLTLTDSTVFHVFDIELIKGDPVTALASPTSFVVSEAFAKKYFGDEDPMNKQLRLNNSTVSVSGIMKNQPDNTEFQYDAIGSLKAMPTQATQAFSQDWFRIGFHTYLLFKTPIVEQEFEEKMVAFEKKYVQPFVAQAGIVASIEYDIYPLSEMHFHNEKEYDLPKGDKTTLLIFSLLAIFILVIAAINFINLSMAQSAKRAKEVGVRKTLGVSRGQLLRQFISESIFITLIATIVGLSSVELLLGPYNELTGKFFTITDVFTPELLSTILVIVLLVGVGAGSYPAFVMSRYQPVKVLKGGPPPSKGIGGFRKILILVQFIFSLFMITGTLLIKDQMDFIASTNLGFDKENVVFLQLPADTAFRRKAPTLLNEIKNTAGIKGIATSAIPAGQTGQLMFRLEMNGALAERTVNFFWIDEQFYDLMGIDLIEGRNFSKEFATDGQQAFIINKTAARQFGWGDNAIGKRVQWGLQANNTATNDGKVVGVVEDFNFLSLHSPLEPLIMLFAPNGTGALTVKLEQGDYRDALASIEDKWMAMSNGQPFNFTFLDQALENNYRSEQQMQQVFSYFAIISVLVATLGLFALISFAVETKTKEIGMRKILGASILNISWIIVKDFFILLAIAFVITAPTNYYFMQKWLEDFAYQVPIPLLSFLTAFLIALVSSVLIVSFHTMKISRSNPINALRYE